MSSTTRRALWAAIPLLAVAAVSLAFVLRSTTQPSKAEAEPLGATWSAGEKRAPAIDLRAADGSPLSLAAFRGRKVIVTFVDPHCTTFCPRESIVLDDAIRALPVAQRPAVVAVSVDPKVQSERVLVQEARRFRWTPQWHWAIGTKAQLAAVWKRYGIMVVPTPDDITHTEAAYVLDARGYQRALLAWPFKSTDVSRALAAAS
ncbi:MAG TPA: SCO family protein [Gaiellaceae bacterium]|nr:SCO family protein [Gaiellaceae bacterium]